MENYIGKKGYTIYKSNLNPNELDKLKKDLTVKPYLMDGFGDNVESFNVFKENNNKIYIPKYYGIDRYGPLKETSSNGKNINCIFNGSIRDNQLEVIDLSMNILNEKGGGILALPCGYGKTVIALKIFSIIGKKTLVIVNKEFLMDQWKERIEEFLPGVKIGRIQQKIIDIENKDIVLVMLKSLATKTYPLDTFDDIGLVIIDECHNICTREYSNALFKVNSNKMLALSATPDRKDGLTKVIKWFVGDIFLKKEREHNDVVIVDRIIIPNTNEEYIKEIHNYLGQVMISTMMTNICNYIQRTHIIFNYIKKFYEIEGNQVLILSERKILLEDLENLMKKNYMFNYGYFIGGMKKNDRDKSIDKKIILATYSMAKEALDIKSLNSLFLITSRTDIIQAVGRVLRLKRDKSFIIDFIDNFSVFKNQAEKRKQYYHKCNYIINNIYVNENGSIIKKEENIQKYMKKKKNINNSDNEEFDNQDDEILDEEYTEEEKKQKNLINEIMNKNIKQQKTTKKTNNSNSIKNLNLNKCLFTLEKEY